MERVEEVCRSKGLSKKEWSRAACRVAHHDAGGAAGVGVSRRAPRRRTSRDGDAGCGARVDARRERRVGGCGGLVARPMERPVAVVAARGARRCRRRVACAARPRSPRRDARRARRRPDHARGRGDLTAAERRTAPTLARESRGRGASGACSSPRPARAGEARRPDGGHLERCQRSVSRPRRAERRPRAARHGSPRGERRRVDGATGDRVRVAQPGGCACRAPMRRGGQRPCGASVPQPTAAGCSVPQPNARRIVRKNAVMASVSCGPRGADDDGERDS